MSDVMLPVQQAMAEAADYAKHALAPNTRAAYRADWADFLAWCQRHDQEPLPAMPETVAAYLASMARTHSPATMRRRLVAIGQAHKLAKVEWVPGHPVVRATLRGILRKHGRPTRKAAALGTAELKRLVATCDRTMSGVRDRAMLLLAYAGALRRSELAAVQREHLTFTAEGMRLMIPRAKSDQTGEGVELGIPRGAKPETCPVKAMEAWLRASDCQYGPVFRKINASGTIELTALHPYSVPDILSRHFVAAGLSASGYERLSSHGLRAGFVTEAYKAGARDEEIMGHTRHRDLKTMRGYVRRAKLLTESPVKKLGL